MNNDESNDDFTAKVLDRLAGMLTASGRDAA